MTRARLFLYMIAATIVAVAFISVFYGYNLNFDRFIGEFKGWIFPALFATAISSQIFYSSIYKRISSGKSVYAVATASILFAHFLMGVFSMILFSGIDYFRRGYVYPPHDGYVLSSLGFSLLTIIFGGPFTFPIGICSVHLFSLTSRSS